MEMNKIQELPYDEQIKRIEAFFSGVEFDEKMHKYYIGGKPMKKSVTSFISKFSNKADFYNIAQNIDRKMKLPAGTTQRIWNYKGDVANARGTKTHFFAEIYAKYRTLKPETQLEYAVKSFIDSLPNHISIAFTELLMWHKECMLPGTGDLILYNKHTNKYIIGDYKTNEDLFKVFNDSKLKRPFEKYSDNKLNKYMLQLNMYQIFLEQVGVEVSHRVLIWLRPDGTFKKIYLEDITDKLKKELIC